MPTPPSAPPSSTTATDQQLTPQVRASPGDWPAALQLTTRLHRPYTGSGPTVAQLRGYMTPMAITPATTTLETTRVPLTTADNKPPAPNDTTPDVPHVTAVTMASATAHRDPVPETLRVQPVPAPPSNATEPTTAAHTTSESPGPEPVTVSLDPDSCSCHAYTGDDRCQHLWHAHLRARHDLLWVTPQDIPRLLPETTDTVGSHNETTPTTGSAPAARSTAPAPDTSTTKTETAADNDADSGGDTNTDTTPQPPAEPDGHQTPPAAASDTASTSGNRGQPTAADDPTTTGATQELTCTVCETAYEVTCPPTADPETFICLACPPADDQIVYNLATADDADTLSLVYLRDIHADPARHVYPGDDGVMHLADFYGSLDTVSGDDTVVAVSTPVSAAITDGHLLFTDAATTTWLPQGALAPITPTDQ